MVENDDMYVGVGMCSSNDTWVGGVGVGLHQRSVLRSSLFAVVIGRLTQEVKQESPWTVMFAGDEMCCESSK